MRFAKYHALGNIYLVIEPAALVETLDEAAIRTICHPHFGVGSDGILLGPLPSQACDFGLNIYNPDCSDAEKSGRLQHQQQTVRPSPLSLVSHRSAPPRTGHSRSDPERAKSDPG